MLKPDRPALILHGHFYQPPRENPWTDAVEREWSAAPFHDWNERIHQECYRANAWSRVFDSYGRVLRIVNNYEHLSYNFGPTLLQWIERHHPPVYRRILKSDRESAAKRGGHGNAIAQGFNHAILPLCNDRDRRTQVRWGMADFRHRFGREPEGMWLPETACNDATLETLIEEGLRFTILSPYQAHRVRSLSMRPADGGVANGRQNEDRLPDETRRNGESHEGQSRPADREAESEETWTEVADGGIDTTVAYRWFHRDNSGRSIDLFFYDGGLARGIAFEGALASSHGLIDRVLHASPGAGRVVQVATDGESYGHHYSSGDRCVAYGLAEEAPRRGLWVTNYAEFLEHFPPAHEVEIKSGPNGEGTAWSCAHGVGRWYRDCGCQGGAREGWNQAWRGPLRGALDFLRDEAARVFESAGGSLFDDPWAARDEYVQLVLDRSRSAQEFLRKHCGGELSDAERVRALSLLEMQRNAMTMYTSCGWFFADLSGLETVQILKYAGRVLDLMEEIGVEPPREGFLSRLAGASSNLPEWGNGADIFQKVIPGVRVSARGIAAHVGISSLLDLNDDAGEVAGHRYERTGLRKEVHGRLTLATCRLAVESIATGRRTDLAIASLHLGGVDFYCVMRPFPGSGPFGASTERLWSQFRTASLPSVLRTAQEEFGPDEFGLENVLPEGRQRISRKIFGELVHRFSDQYARLYEDNRRLIDMLQDAGFELPVELRTAAEFTLGRRLEDEIRRQKQGLDPEAYENALRIADEVERRGYSIDRAAASRVFSDMIVDVVQNAAQDLDPDLLSTTHRLIGLARKLGLQTDLDRAQEALYEALGQDRSPSDSMRDLASTLSLAPVLWAAPDESANGRGGGEKTSEPTEATS